MLSISRARPTLIFASQDRSSAQDAVTTSVFIELVQSLLEAHWHRCRTLVFSLYGVESSANSAVSLDHFQSLHIPNLRHLSVMFADTETRDSWGAGQASLKFLGNFPVSHSLQTLVIQDIAESDDILPLVGHSSISSLTRLFFGGDLEPHLVLQLLQQLPTLEHLALQGNFVSNGSPITPLRVSLPCLLSISIQVTRDIPQSLLALLDAPRLVQADVFVLKWNRGSAKFPALRRFRCLTHNIHHLSSFVQAHPCLEELAFPIPFRYFSNLLPALRLARNPPHLPTPTNPLLVSLHTRFGANDALEDPIPFAPSAAADLARILALRIKPYSIENAKNPLTKVGLEEGVHYLLVSIWPAKPWPDAFAYSVGLSELVWED